MTRSPARFTQAEVTKLIKAARSTGFECVTIEVLPGTAGLRAIYTAGPAAKEEPSELQAWIAKRDRRRRAEQASSVGALAAAQTEPESVMTEEEWATAVRASDLSNRERMALEALVQRRGRDVPIGEIKGAGITTQKSLETRGYATIKMDGDRFISWRVTNEGERFFRQIASLPPYF